MKGCPTTRELTKALSAGPSQALRRHLDACVACREEWLSTEAVIDAAMKLPDGVPSPEALRHAEQQLLFAARSLPAPKRGIPRLYIASAAAVVLAAGATLFFVLQESPRSTAPPKGSHRGTVVAEDGARFTHSTSRDGPRQDETVRLFHGTVTLHVAPLKARERFRVLTDDAEVEVRGTVFSVRASNRSLVAVSVESGEVLVRPSSGDEVLLTSGGQWRRREDDTADAPPHAEAPATKAAPQVKARGGPPSNANRTKPAAQRKRARDAASKNRANDIDAAFKEGWTRYKAGAYREAAAIFDEAVLTSGPVPQAEDLYFWRAAAHFKSRRNGAGEALSDFLALYPNAPRKNEIRLMYGWHLLGKGKLDAARAEFNAVVKSPVGAVRKSAREGLGQLDGRPDTETPTFSTEGIRSRGDLQTTD